MPRPVSMPMYDLPEIAGANDALWAKLAQRLADVADVPATLTRPDDLTELWRRPDLLLAQTCGYPLMTTLAGAVRLVATPCYRASGCRGVWHRSMLVVGRDSPARHLRDLRGATAAINDWHSNTGMNLLRAAVSPHAEGGRFFARVVVSGAHWRSLALVAEGEADIAAIDAVTHALLARHRPALVRRTRILRKSIVSPGLPLITAARTDEATVARLRAALADAIADPGLAEVRDALLLDGFAVLDEAPYRRIMAIEARAAARNYPRLA